jgi:hypothetical protein
MFTKKITDLFTTDLLNAVSGVLGEAKKCGDCGCAKCTCEPEEEDEPEETKEGYVSHAQRKAVWANRADDGKGHPDKKKMKKEGYMPTNDMPSDKDRKVAGKLGAMLKREREAKEKKEPMGVKTEEVEDLDEKRGLWDNIHAKRKRIKAGSGERMRKPGSKGAPTAADFKASANEAFEQIDEISAGMAQRYLKGKRERDYDISPDGTSSKLKKPQTFAKMNKDVKSSMRALKTIEKAKKANEEFESMHEEKHPIVKEYDSLKKHDIKTLRGMISQQNKVVDTSEFKTKDHAISHYLRNKHGNKKVDTAFGFKEEVEIEESTYDKMMTAKKTWAAYPTASNERAYKAAKELHKKNKTNEEVEKLDEISKATMGRYINKAKNQIDAASWRTGYRQGSNTKADSTNDAVLKSKEKQLSKRHTGIETAVKKLTKEEQEFIDALNADTLDEARGRPKKAGAKDFTIHPKTKEKLMHDNPEHMAKIERLQKTGMLKKQKTEANQHIIQQLQRAKTSMRGGETIHFTHGDSTHVAGTHAAKLLDKYAGMKPSEKETFQKKIGHSHANLKSEL